jgi:daunorubicin resistance ABC transporter membrane protein
MSGHVGASTSGLGALAALVAREWRRLLRQPSRVVATMVTAAVLWAFLAGGFAEALNPGRVERYSLYLLPGMATMIVTFGSIFGAISLIQDRHSGFLQSALASPAPRWSIVGAKLLGVVTIAGSQGALVLLAAPALGARPGALGWATALLVVIASAIAVGGLSLALAWRIDSIEGFHGVMNLVLAPMWLLSGAFFPAASAHPALSALMAINPLRWATDALRAAMDGATPDARAIGATVGFAIVGCGLAWGAMGRSPRAARRPAPGGAVP